MQRPRLIVPTWLAVSALGTTLACDNENESEGSEGTSESSGPNECYDIPEQDACEAEEQFECAWVPDQEGCIPNCVAYTDEATCNGDIFCLWDGNACTMGSV